MLGLLSPVKADASQYAAVARAVSASQTQSAALLDVGYYGGGDYYGDDQKQDYSDDRKPDYYSGGGYNSGGHDGGYGSGYSYSHHQEHHEYYPDGCCNHHQEHHEYYPDQGCYKKKWVCEESVPHCLKQRECVWYYGKEYCRYVHRCIGGGDRYCKWISVHSHDCGYQ